MLVIEICHILMIWNYKQIVKDYGLRTIIVGHTTVQNFGILDDNSVWRSSKLLKDGRVSSIGIDTGIFLKREVNPRLSALELSSGRVVSQKRVEKLLEIR
jgi:hypothetical protein